MTKLEEQYRKNIGKLYAIHSREWGGKERGWLKVDNVVLVTGIDKQGGWFHYVCDIVKYNITSVPDVINHYRLSCHIPCKEFLRDSKPALSLLGDTEKKEVA